MSSTTTTSTPSSSSSASLPLGKTLASTDKKTRDKAVKSLAIFLSDPDRDALPSAEMAKLWRGIFYCFWMSDKPLVQQALSTELAELLLTITSMSTSLAFLQGFWKEIVQQWNGIDRLRMDKYYMLIRRFVNASLRLLARADWDEDACNEYNAILTCNGAPLCFDDNRVPTSIGYHLADIYLEELDKVLAVVDNSTLPAPLSIILAPFFELASRTNSSVTLQRLFSSLFDPLFAAINPHANAEPMAKRIRLEFEPSYVNVTEKSCLRHPKEEGKLTKPELMRGLVRQLFDTASSPDTREANRRRMYAVWKAAMAEEEEGISDA